MGTILEHVKENNAINVTSAVEDLLKQKTLAAIDEARKQVAAETFNTYPQPPEKDVNEEIDAAYNSGDVLEEARGGEPDKILAGELKDKALYNHHQFHQGNHDARHGGWARHNLHQWSDNYNKKRKKGVYDKEKAVKGLTYAIKNSEPSYFGKAHHEKSGQTVSGATRMHAARLLLPHVEKLMDGKKLDEAKNPVQTRKPHPQQAAFNAKWAKANDQERAMLKKHAWKHDFDIPWEGSQSKNRSAIHDFSEGEAEKEVKERKPHPKQAQFDKQWHAADEQGKKMLKKIAWKHDFDLPWDDKKHPGRSPIHDFSEDEVAEGQKKSFASSLWKGLGGKAKDGKKPVTAKDLMRMSAPASKKVNEEYLTEVSQAIPWPAKSKHLKDYTKKKGEEGPFKHPEGHSIEISKDKGEITHTDKGGKKKTFKNMGDLNVHLMKVHGNFDQKVKDHEAKGWHHCSTHMGKLSYAHHKKGTGDHEDNAVDYKAAHRAAMNIQGKERKSSRAAYDAFHKGDKE